MNLRMLKRLCLTIVCVSMLAAMFAVTPVASYPAGQRGPRVDLLRQKVTRSPAAQLIEMQNGPPAGSDIWEGLIRPTDIEDMDARGKQISSRGGFHYCEIGLNYRTPPLDDVNFRHALAHLIPKDRIIGSLFRYIDVKVDTPVPPAQSLWYNPGVDPHPYSPAAAEAVLEASPRFEKVGGVWQYSAAAGGGALEHLRFFTPLEVVAPTSFTIGRMVVEEAQNIGLMNIEQVPMDFATYLDLTYNQWQFEMFWVCYGLGRYPTHLWDLFNSINNFPGSANPYGINYPELDAATNTLYFSLDRTAQIAAAQLSQELLMGGTTTDPMPDYVPPEDPRSQALPVFAVYSRNYYDIAQPQVKGLVNMFGNGIRNMWTYMNMYWDTTDEYRPGTTDKTIVRVEDEFPERMNPLFATTVYANDWFLNILEGLIVVNPYTHKDEPWLATSWSYEVTPGGMDVTFNLRLTDLTGAPITWQDNTPISINDVQFNWDFLADWEVPNFWGAFQYYDSSTLVDADTIVAHMTQASVWHVYSLAGTSHQLAPQVWDRAWADLPTILGYDPSAHAYPDPDGGGPLTSVPTELFGTGPFISMHSTTTIGTQAYGDLQAYRNYWLRTSDIEQMIADMFWSAGDVDRSGNIDTTDLAAIGLAYLTTPGDALWNSNADVTGPAGTPPDSVVDIFDLSTAGKFYGETRTNG
jgi:ABC-type transport system substrate-binding protein